MNDQKTTAVDLPNERLGDKGACVAREKCWDENTPEQKIQRLGDAVESLSRRLADQEDNIDAVLRHTHGAGGALLVPLGRNDVDRRFNRAYIDRNPLNRERAR